jgi:hypothetical protein
MSVEGLALSLKDASERKELECNKTVEKKRIIE